MDTSKIKDGPKNLMDGLFEQMNRVREIIKEYKSIPGNAGMFAAALMDRDIDLAEEAIKQNDVIKMLSAYKSLQSYEL